MARGPRVGTRAERAGEGRCEGEEGVGVTYPPVAFGVLRDLPKWEGSLIRDGVVEIPR